MLLALDVGNTHTVLGFYEGDELKHDFRLESHRGRSRDELHILLRSLLGLADLAPSAVHRSILASVVPAVTDGLVQAVEACFGHRPLVVGPGIRTGMPILYENPREVGADRIVNAVAAFEKVRRAVIVVDFGTATTFDVVSSQGEYLGGVITPGIRISADALFSRAAKLPPVSITKPPRVVGRNTVHSIQSGLVFGYVGLVDGIVNRVWDELGDRTAVLATGGLARLVQPESATIERVEENLTLEGLRILDERNRPG